MFRTVLVVTFLAVGRGGEVALSSRSSSTWDHDLECLLQDWSELKTGKQKSMGYVCDRFTFLLDFYHALGCYFIIGGSDRWMKSGTPSGKQSVIDGVPYSNNVTFTYHG
jgi:hypothetical protein